MKTDLWWIPALVLCVVPIGRLSLQARERTSQDGVAAPLFVRIGCSSCHGTAGQGTIAGPRLAPYPVLFERFEGALRQPISDMPRYSSAAIGEPEAREIYAYLTSIKPGLKADQIPILKILVAARGK